MPGTRPAANPRPHRPPRELVHAPDGTSWTARENLAEILRGELLGPADGDEEVLDVPPDTRYLIGRIAPTKLAGTGDLASAAEDDAEAANDSTLDLGTEHEAQASRGVPLTPVDDSSVDGDDDTPGDSQDEPVKRGLMIPASMGLRFQVGTGVDQVTVRASWGVYNPKRAGEHPDGRPIYRYVRTPIDVAVTLRFAGITPGVTASYDLIDDVKLRVDVFLDDSGSGQPRRLVEIALCNDRTTPRRIPVNAWMFQTQLHVEAGGAEVFLPVRDVLEEGEPDAEDELRRLRLQYRHRLEFAVGRTCSVGWTIAPGARRATQVRTEWLPVTETPQTSADDVPGTVLDMTVLAKADAETIEAALRPIVDGYASWLGLPGAAPPADGRATQTGIADALSGHLADEAHDAITDAARVHTQLAEGLDFLVHDEEALRCFRFMNRVMAQQRIHSQIAEERSKDKALSVEDATATVLGKGPRAHSWRTFQIAFILMQIPAICRPDHPRRSGPLNQVELLFFPTGGGKTEAYLGLAAFTFAIRRRAGILATPDGDLDGGDGVSVLMRYTLRLLTAQQFQRATTLICAAEMARREEPHLWGETPFRIGLWVGTAVSPKRVKEAAEQLATINDGYGHRFTALQIRRCPWCGTEIDHRSVRIDAAQARVRVYCGDDLATCPFAEGGAVDDGLPVLTVDEEIYRLTPAFVIATVDKFARLAREGQAAALFGYVRTRCERHGYVHEDDEECTITEAGTHKATNGLGIARKRPTGRLRPPDLIIQDELHLITGALGTAVGLFEVAIDALTTWRTPTGATAKPLIVASTATVRNARDQVRNLYGRDVTIFPPQVTDVADTFFSKEVPITPSTPGRRYVGISTTGVRLTTAEIRVAEVLMAAAQHLLDTSGKAADPYLTLVGYFNATRELAGMTRYMQDDVQTALAQGKEWTGLPVRYGRGVTGLHLAELTSRVSGSDITATLDEMAIEFDPAFDSTAARAARRHARRTGKEPPKRDGYPYDAVLATSMLQVGVDVTRLGLMLLVGQPKNTAEYIQASSRVGRDGHRPGLVVTLGNWARPRDLAHYEQFRHYHETFYSQVEPLSVTPFSATSLERGLEGVLVSAARVLQAATPDGLSPEKSAGRIIEQRPFMEGLTEALLARILAGSGDEVATTKARERLVNRLDQWEERRRHVIEVMGLSLAYERVKDGSHHAPLLRSAENVRSREADPSEAPFVVANSMREVQPEINILVSPDPKKLLVGESATAPGWEFPAGGSDS